jgi:single-strand DNA-binding protein
MSSVNRIIIVGNLGATPELRYTQNGQAVASMSVATTDTWSGKDGVRNERTTWHRCNVWGKLAETCAQHLTKGRTVYVEGSYESREYTDKQGANRVAYEVKVDKVTFIGSGKRDDGAQQAWVGDAPAKPQQSSEPDFGDDPIPF